MTRRDRKVLFGLEVALACSAFIFAVITAIWRDWIEIVFGVDPDKGSGSLEWLIVAVSLAVAVTCGVAARAQWQRLRPEQALLRDSSPRTDPGLPGNSFSMPEG